MFIESCADVEQIAEASRDLATLAGRSQSTLNDLEIVLGNIGIKTSELQKHMEMTRGAVLACTLMSFTQQDHDL